MAISTSFVSNAFPLAVSVLAKVKDSIEIARSHFKLGMQHFEREEYGQAIQEFQIAYDLSGRPNPLLNIGSCYLALKEPEKALEAYRLYLEKDPQSARRGEVEAWIAELEEQIQQRKEKEQPKPDPGPTKPPIVPKKKITPARVVDTYVPPRTKKRARLEVTDSPARPTPYRTLMWTSLGLSLVGLAVGGISYYQAGRKENEYADLVGDLKMDGKVTGRSGTNRFADSAAQERHDGQLNDVKGDMEKWDTIAAVGFVSAAVTLGLGGLFFWVGRDEPYLTLHPNAGGGSVQMRLDF